MAPVAFQNLWARMSEEIHILTCRGCHCLKLIQTYQKWVEYGRIMKRIHVKLKSFPKQDGKIRVPTNQRQTFSYQKQSLSSL